MEVIMNTLKFLIGFITPLLIFSEIALAQTKGKLTGAQRQAYLATFVQKYGMLGPLSPEAIRKILNPIYGDDSPYHPTIDKEFSAGGKAYLKVTGTPRT